ncbi:hypothetical protein ABVK33_10065 [Mycobacterium kansasii]|uniref:hypothetical protein n=1 Tax=Mycobacterium kansasii TaxID=1768 RepID=UPI000F034D66|nr:hypothetical protein [Mycobacterium kansasii]
MRFSARTDRLAVEVFQRAQQSGQPVTMPLVKAVIAELDAEASSQQVYGVAMRWERAIGAARRRARA